MSSVYIVPSIDQKIRLFVGWDDDLKTLFLHVILLDRNIGEGIGENLGTSQGEIVDVEQIDRAIKKYSKAFDGLSPTLYKTLFDEVSSGVE